MFESRKKKRLHSFYLIYLYRKTNVLLIPFFFCRYVTKQNTKGDDPESKQSGDDVDDDSDDSKSSGSENEDDKEKEK